MQIGPQDSHYGIQSHQVVGDFIGGKTFLLTHSNHPAGEAVGNVQLRAGDFRPQLIERAGLDRVGVLLVRAVGSVDPDLPRGHCVRDLRDGRQSAVSLEGCIQDFNCFGPVTSIRALRQS